jgi:D-serine deaminase-like pyridoxal phosphate-dependent protein
MLSPALELSFQAVLPTVQSYPSPTVTLPLPALKALSMDNEPVAVEPSVALRLARVMTLPVTPPATTVVTVGLVSVAVPPKPEKLSDPSGYIGPP